MQIFEEVIDQVSWIDLRYKESVSDCKRGNKLSILHSIDVFDEPLCACFDQQYRQSST